MKKSEAREMLVQLLLKKSAGQGDQFTREETEWLIDEGPSFSDEDLGAMIGEQAVVVFRQIVALIS
jgi:hypothetical protein